MHHHGNFTFAVSFQLGVAVPEEELKKCILIVLFGAGVVDGPLPQKSAVRRLYWESYSSAAVDISRRMAPEPGAEKPRALPQAERTSRLKALKSKPGEGFKSAEELESSDVLADKFVTMHGSGVLLHLTWEDSTKWCAEIRGVKK